MIRLWHSHAIPRHLTNNSNKWNFLETFLDEPGADENLPITLGNPLIEFPKKFPEIFQIFWSCLEWHQKRHKTIIPWHFRYHNMIVFDILECRKVIVIWRFDEILRPSKKKLKLFRKVIQLISLNRGDLPIWVEWVFCPKMFCKSFKKFSGRF